MKTRNLAAMGCWGMVLSCAAVLAASDGTLVAFRSVSNSTPRIVSMWGGGGSEQIILKSDGTVWDWGLNSEGQLGNGSTNNTALPVQVLGPGGVGHLSPVAAIMGGEIHNFALKSDGTVWAWGWNLFGQLGDGSTNWGTLSNYSKTPVQVAGLTSVKSLGGRGYHSLAMKNDGTVWDWGCNRHGELGNGATYSGTNNPVQVIGLTNPASISGGGFFSLALMPDGTLRAWGENDHGECGDGSGMDRPTLVPVAGLTNVIAISGGWFHALALKADGTVWSWGDNSKGELGDGTTSRRLSPVRVIGLSNIVSVSTGDGNSMARGADNSVWKWGDNVYGELGNGTSDTNAHPVATQVTGFSNVVLSVCRDYHNICIKRDGTVWVWGDNRYGGCGDLTGNSVLRPRLMPGLVTGNTILYDESFETYPNGLSLAGTNNWYSDNPGAGIVTATNYASLYAGTYPVSGPHQAALQINGAITNRFCPSFYTNVWVDMILQANPPASPMPPLSGTAFALCVTTNGRLAVWNCTNPPAGGNGWTELGDVNLGTNAFFRATVQADYTPDANGFYYYSVWVNGVASTNPVTGYAAADSSQSWFGEIVASGNFLMDDLVVQTSKPFYTLTASSTGYGGFISPPGPTIVTSGSDATFMLAASNWYHLASVLVDENNAGTPNAFTFTNVSADHSIIAHYAADLAANNTPKWWLYQANTNWASDFDAAALGDQDGDGVPTWQEYVAGTDPMDGSSAFSLNIAFANGQVLASFPTIPATAQYQLQRYYALDTSVSLAGAQAWQEVQGMTNVQGLGQTLVYTNLPGASNSFFRGRVWLGP
jgi:alpha-tubulin suppressor-like RCC1 family protein